MLFAIIDINELKEIDPDWEFRRKSNDGTKAIIHKEILEELKPDLKTLGTLSETGETSPYPYQLEEGDIINDLPEFNNNNDQIV